MKGERLNPSNRPCSQGNTSKFFRMHPDSEISGALENANPVPSILPMLTAQATKQRIFVPTKTSTPGAR